VQQSAASTKTATGDTNPMGKRKDTGADKDLPAPTAGSALAAASNISDDDQQDVEVPIPFIGFYSKKSNRSAEVKNALPGITEGSAFVCYNGDEYAHVQAVQILDGQQRYFSKSDSDGRKIAAGLTETADTPNENVLAVVLAYTADKIIPTVTEFRSTKVRCVRDFVSAAARTEAEGWSDRQGPIGQRLAALGARLRIVGEITLQQKTSKKTGNIYHLGRCACKVLNDSQVQLLIDAMADADFDGQVKSCLDKKEGRWKWLQSEFMSTND
jgi:hypothetical protein